jgi:5'-nucleotidase
VIFLLTNDDGIEAPGLAALRDAVGDLADCWTVAPATEQSAKSHALTMHEPLRVVEHGPRRFSVTGTPADCVYLAVNHLLPERPAMVLSGINRGSNLATDVHYSGTVAAAREASVMDIPALAASLWTGDSPPHWDTAAAVVKRLVRELRAHGLPPGVLINLNVPDVPLDKLRGVRAAAMGRRWYVPLVEAKTDPRGRRYFWIGGDHERFDDVPDTDGPLCEEGFATVTPLMLDLTAHSFLPTLKSWNLDDP